MINFGEDNNMATGLEQTFLDRLKDKTKVIFTQTTWDKYFKDTQLKDLVLDPSFTYDADNQEVRGKIINYHSEIILEQTRWKTTRLSDLMKSEYVYTGRYFDFFTEPSDQVLVDYDRNICIIYLNDPDLTMSITAAQFKSKMLGYLLKLTGYDFSDVGSVLNLQGISWSIGKEFPDLPTQVSAGAVVGGVTLTGNITNGTVYIIDQPIKALATENLKRVLKE